MKKAVGKRCIFPAQSRISPSNYTLLLFHTLFFTLTFFFVIKKKVKALKKIPASCIILFSEKNISLRWLRGLWIELVDFFFWFFFSLAARNCAIFRQDGIVGIGSPRGAGIWGPIEGPSLNPRQYNIDVLCEGFQGGFSVWPRWCREAGHQRFLEKFHRDSRKIRRAFFFLPRVFFVVFLRTFF